MRVDADAVRRLSPPTVFEDASSLYTFKKNYIGLVFPTMIYIGCLPATHITNHDDGTTILIIPITHLRFSVFRTLGETVDFAAHRHINIQDLRRHLQLDPRQPLPWTPPFFRLAL